MTLSPGAQLVALAIDDQDRRSLQDHGGLAAPGLVERRIARAASRGARVEPVPGDVGPLPGQGRGELLDPMASPAPFASLATADDRHVPALVEPQELGQAEVEAARDPRCDRQGRAGLAALHLREHRRRHSAAVGEVT